MLCFPMRVNKERKRRHEKGIFGESVQNAFCLYPHDEFLERKIWEFVCAIFLALRACFLEFEQFL